MGSETKTNQMIADGPDDRVCAIIVCYRPEPVRLASLIQACLNQAVNVVLVNNGEPISPEIVGGGDGRIHRIDPQGNLGLAGAQNLGVRWAATQGFAYLIFFDQDSVPQSGLIKTLRETFDAKAETGELVAAVGPCLKDARDGTITPFVRFNVWGVERIYPTSDLSTTECDFLISSGMFTSVNRFLTIGLWEDNLFVDNVDMEWCFRARSRGYRCIGVGATHLDHIIGEQVSRLNLLGRSWAIYRHPPARQYYMMRNRMALYKRGYVPMAWKVQDIPRALFKFIFFGLISGSRRENLRCLMMGLRDGWCGRFGAFYGTRDT